MKTAVIVSGIMREMDLAIPTWNINGDFFLFVQDTYQAARRLSEQQKIIKNIEPLSDKFKAICIVDKINTANDFNITVINQTWKWKVAYNLLKPYIVKEGYDRFIFIRPDSYLNIYRNLDELVIEPGVYYSTSKLLTDSNGLLFANETWIAGDVNLFEILSNFYDYVSTTSHVEISNIHHGLATYLKKNNIHVTDDLLSFGENYQLRPEVRNMFEGNMRQDKYSYNDIAKRLVEWNNNKDKAAYRNA
jgi:hypothetical protein